MTPARRDRVQFQAVAVRHAGRGHGADRPPPRYIKWMRLLTAITVAALVTLRLTAQMIDGAPRITQEEFKKLRAAGNVILVDTRNPDAYEFSHIPGAVLLPLEGLQTWPAEYETTFLMLKAAKKPIVTYCA